MPHGKSLLIALSLSSLCGVASAQSVTAETNMNLSGHWSVKDSGTTSASINDTGNDQWSSREAWVSAKHKVVKVYGWIQTGDPQASNAANWSVATGAWSDKVTIDAPGLTGQSGTYTFQFLVDGSLTASGSVNDSLQSYAEAETTIKVNGWINEFRDAYMAVDGFVGDGYLNKLVSITTPITFGTPFDLSMSVTAASYTKNNSANPFAMARADLGHTATWEGITAVTGPNGDVTNFTVTSASGTDYVNAVPEPASMAALGLGALTLLRRRRQG
jgi:hypothetical protein